MPPAIGDSGWVGIGRGEIVRLEHALEAALADHFIDLRLDGDLFTTGVDRACCGLDACLSGDGGPTYEYGATWNDLGRRYGRLTRGLSDDGTANQVGLRLWAGQTVHLPLVLREW
jgi:hypothetical protein